MTPKLQGSVGPPLKKAKNKPVDVDLISKMLWANGHKVTISNKINNTLLAAIAKAQKNAKSGDTDGVIKPGDKTVKALSAKYTAEARRIANLPKMYEVDFDGKCQLVTQKEYDEQRLRALKILTTYVTKMKEADKRLAEGHEALLKMKNNQHGFMKWAAMTMVHVVYDIDYPKAELRFAAQKAIKAFESAVKMKDFKKIQKTMPIAEKASMAWADEFNRWWKEATGRKEKLQWWIATGKTTGWLAVGFFLAPATTVIAGGWGGAVLAAGITGKVKYYVDNLDTVVNGTPTAALKVAMLSEVAAAKEMRKAAIGGALGKGVDKFTPAIASRLMARFPELTKPTAEAWSKRALNAMSGAIDGFVGEAIDSAANSMIGKGKNAEAPKSFQDKITARIWDALLAGAVGELDDAFRKKWDPATSPVVNDLFASAAERNQIADNKVKQWRSRLATPAIKTTANEIKNLVVANAKGNEKSTQLVNMADKRLANSKVIKDRVASIVAAEATAR